MRREIQQPADDSIRLISLTQGQVAIVDAWHYERLKPFKWHAHASKNKFYAIRAGRDGEPKRVSMAREIMQCPPEYVVDHRNDEATLDNREANLRIATLAENARNQSKQRNNTSGFIGVSRHGGRSKRWKAYINRLDEFGNTRRICLGHYLDPVEAARVRDRKAIEFHGDFAFLNFPRSDYDLSSP